MLGERVQERDGGWSREEAERLVAECRASGKRMKEFAGERDLDFNALRGWAAQLRRNANPRRHPEPSRPAAFVELDVVRDDPETLCVAEIVLANGMRLVLRDEVGVKDLRTWSTLSARSDVEPPSVGENLRSG